MKMAIIFIITALILTGCEGGTDPNSKDTVINNQETEEGTAKEVPEQEIPEEKTSPELEIPEEKIYPKLEPLSVEMERQIREDYCNHKIKHWHLPPNTVDTSIDYVFITGYYGTYGNCIAVMFNDGVWTMGREYIIAGVRFGYPDSNTIKIWNEGDFYELQEAFDLELLDREDLENIAYYWYNRRR